MGVLSKGTSFTASAGTKVAVLTKTGLPPQTRNQGCSSAQRQAFHCKPRNQDCSFVQRQVFHRKLRNQGCSSVQRQVFHRKLREQGCSSVQRQVFHCKLRNQVFISAEDRSSTANSAAVSQGMNRCGGFPLLYAPHSLFNIWTDPKRSEMFPGAPTWR